MTAEKRYIITEELVKDIQTCFEYGCDGTLPNHGELLHALRSRPYVDVLDELLEWVNNADNHSYVETGFYRRVYVVNLADLVIEIERIRKAGEQG